MNRGWIGEEAQDMGLSAGIHPERFGDRFQDAIVGLGLPSGLGEDRGRHPAEKPAGSNA